jgi:hypothetical protein
MVTRVKIYLSATWLDFTFQEKATHHIGGNDYHFPACRWC